MNPERLRRLRAEANERMKLLCDKVEAENRTALSEEETKQYESAKSEYEALGVSIAIAEEQERRDAELASVRPAIARRSFCNPIAEPAKKEFDSLGEFVHAVVGGSDQRLEYQASQNMGSGSAGGFAVPAQYATELMKIDAQGAAIRPLCTNLPAGSPPDAELSIPTLNQSSSMYGGVSLTWLDDESGSDFPETSASLGNVTVKPHAVGGTVVLTNRLLQNWNAASSLMQQLLSGALVHAFETAIASGNGVAKPLGILNAAWAGLKKVNRAGATAVSYADLTSLEEAAVGTNFHWVISRRAVKAIKQIANTTYGPLFVEGGQNMAPTLLGHPYVIDRRGVALGTLGDVMFGDFSSYIVKEGSGPFIAASEHVNFKKNETVLRIVANIDGQPWNKTTFTDVDGATVAPIVALDVPA